MRQVYHFNRLIWQYTLLIICLYLILVHPAHAGKFNVPIPYSTIQSAIDAASAGDTVFVSGGTYYEYGITTKEGIVLLSETGTADCAVIDAQGQGRVINCSGTVTIKGFTFTGGKATDGAGMYCNSHSFIINCAFIADTAGAWGGGVYIVTQCDPVFLNCTFKNNYAGTLGGGVSYHTNCDPTFSHCRFIENRAVSYGGGYANWMGGYPKLEYCTFAGNICDNEGGAMFCWFANPRIDHCTFYGNAAPSGGAIFVHQCSTPISNSILSFSDTGAAIHVNAGGAPGLSCSDIYGNAGGDWVGGIAGQEILRNNLCADPCFVDAEHYNFYLEGYSPCLNDSCGQIGAYGFGSPYPGILSIADIANDNGRQVRIRWVKSIYDDPDYDIQVTGYEVYRKETGPEKQAMINKKSIPFQSIRKTAIKGWDYLLSVPAHGDSIYQTIVPTLYDSTINNGMHWSIFLIRAITTDQFVYYSSMPDSGYSLDNLEPGTPSGLIATLTDSSIRISWQPVTDEDFNYYAIYKSAQSGFDPDTMEYYTTTIDTSLNDNQVEKDMEYFYRISAVDFSGNESSYSKEIGGSVTFIPAYNKVPKTFELFQNYPNPFNPVTIIRYQLPVSSNVKLIISTILGQEIAVLVNHYQKSGFYEVPFNASALASGIYIYSLQIDSKSINKKMIVVK